MKVHWMLFAGLILISLTLSVVRADVDCDALAERDDLSEAEQKQLLECLEEAEEEMDLIKQLEGDDDGSGALKKRGFFSKIKKAAKKVGKFVKKHKSTIKAVATGIKIASKLIGKREMATPSKVTEVDCSNVPYAELTDDVKLKEYMEKLSEEQREKVLACVEVTVLGAEAEAADDSDVDDDDDENDNCNNIPYEKLIEDEDVEEYLSGLCEEKQEQVLECLKLAEVGMETVAGGDDDSSSVEKRGLFSKIKKAVKKVKKFVKKNKKTIKAVATGVRIASAIFGKREMTPPEVPDLMEDDDDDSAAPDCDDIPYEKLIEDEDVEEYLSGLSEEKQNEVLECLKLAELGVELGGGDDDSSSVEKRGLFSKIKKAVKKVKKFVKKHKKTIKAVATGVRIASAIFGKREQTAAKVETEMAKRGFFKKLIKTAKKVQKFVKKHKDTIKKVVDIIAKGKRELEDESCPDIKCEDVQFDQLDDDTKMDAYLSDLKPKQRQQVETCLEAMELTAETSDDIDDDGGDDDDDDDSDDNDDDAAPEKRGLLGWIKGKAKKVKNWINKQGDKVKQVVDVIQSWKRGAPTEKANDVEADTEKRGVFGKLKAAVKKIIANLKKPKIPYPTFPRHPKLIK